MTRELSLTQPQWDLLVDLLEREHDELPAEIHHTYARAYRQQLQDRRTEIEAILECLRSAAPAASMPVDVGQ